MTEAEELKKEIEKLKITNRVLHEINQLQAERLLQWQTRFEAKEFDEEINELARKILRNDTME